jgi:hypothetical protein
MAAKTMVFAECGGVLLCAHTAEDPRPDEWEAYVDYCLRIPNCAKTLVVTDGGGPNAAQRKVLQDRYLSKQRANHKQYLVAVLTDSALVRGIVKALNWFNPDANSFPYNGGQGVAAAIQHLRVDAATGDRIRVELTVMRRQLGRMAPSTRAAA